MKSGHMQTRTIFLPFLAIAAAGLMVFISLVEPVPSFNWSGVRKEIRDSLIQFEGREWLSGPAVGVAGLTPRKWHTRKWLMAELLEKECFALMEHPTGAIKAIAYETLLRKSPDLVYPLLNRALMDTTTFFIYQGACISMPLMIGEYLCDYVVGIPKTAPPLPREVRVETSGLSIEEPDQLEKLYRKQLAKKEEYLRKWNLR